MTEKVAKKKTPVGVVGRIMAILIGLAVLAGAAGKYWLIPSFIRDRVERAIDKYWDGPVRIGHIDFNYFGPTTLSGVVLLDRSGRQWVNFGSVHFDFDKWPGTHPVLRGIRIAGLSVTACRHDGKYTPPIKSFPRGPSSLKEYIELDRITVEDFFVWLNEGDGGRDKFVPVGEIDSTQITIRPDGRFDVSAPLVRLATEVPLDISDLLAKDAGIKDGKIEAPALSFKSCGGQVQAFFYALIGGEHKISYGGRAIAETIDLQKLFGSINPETRITRGAGMMAIEVLGGGLNIDGLWAKGELALENVDLEGVGFYNWILKLIGIDSMKFGQSNCFECLFALAGPAVTIEKAKLTNPEITMVIEPGGTINLRTKQVDFYVVPARLEELRETRPLAELLAMLTRFRVKGAFTDPPKKLVQKETLKDIERGTAEYLAESFAGNALRGSTLSAGRIGLKAAGMAADWLKREHHKDRPESQKTGPESRQSTQPAPIIEEGKGSEPDQPQRHLRRRLQD